MRAPATPALCTEGVSFAYGSQVALDGVTLQLAPGEFTALVGPNGAGKSTLLRIVLGLLPAQRGRIEVFGVPPARLRDRWRIGYVPQRPRLTPDLPATVEEVVAAGRLAKQGWWRRPRPADRAAVVHALESVALDELRGARVATLSGGQQQRVLIAKALASEPELLILDEPIAGVDARAQRLFRQSLVHLLREHGAAVLLVSHELGAVAEDLDRVVVLRNRIVFDGKPSELADTGVSLGIHADDLPRWLEELRPDITEEAG
jgi:zinc transport system ATP-binding protein